MPAAAQMAAVPSPQFAVGPCLSRPRLSVLCQSRKGAKQQRGSSKGFNKTSAKQGSGGKGGGSGSVLQSVLEAEEPRLTSPLQTTVVAELTGLESMPAPLWGTFCGVSNGMWVGVTAAFSPSTGEAETVGLDDNGKEVKQLWQCAVEERRVDDGPDRVLRHTARASSPDSLQREMQQGGLQQFEPSCSTSSAECWDTEVIPASQEGFFIFDGGSYSRGPGVIGWLAAQRAATEANAAAAPLFDDQAAALAAAAAGQGIADMDSQHLSNESEANASGSDEEEEAAERGAALEYIQRVEEAAAGGAADWASFELEHCLQWGGERRVRVRMSLDTAGGGDGSELDVDLLRVAVSAEQWEGLPGTYCLSSQPETTIDQQAASAAARLFPSSMCGVWKVFEISSCMVEDVSMETGLPMLLPVYEVQETRQQLLPPEPGCAAQGGTLWLQHNVAVELQLVPDEEEGEGGLPGLQISTWWLPCEGTLVTMTRRYAPDGRLDSVAASTAVRDSMMN